jgi:hypothetical protein
MPLLLRHPIIPLLVAIGVTLVGEFVCPSKAAAGCGDYIVYTNQSDAARHSSDMPADDPKPLGCHGPNCRQAPPPPTLPGAPAKTRLASDDRVSLDSSITTPDPLSVTLSTDTPVGQLVRRGTDVFHPPR